MSRRDEQSRLGADGFRRDAKKNLGQNFLH